MPGRRKGGADRVEAAGTVGAEAGGRLTIDSDASWAFVGSRVIALEVQVLCAEAGYGAFSLAPNGVGKRGYCLA
jgi:hypothetical protein